MKRAAQAGFTLIELVVVIVILGILAAVAVPQFIDTSSEARTAVGNSACGALQSSAVMLYASKKTSSTIAQIIAATQTQGVQLDGTTCNGVTAYVPSKASPGTGGTVPCNVTIAFCTP